ncbi:transporter [Novilysobacter antarcticus]|uniref:transporter n=1 Tax=Novilysobacter antarcticus TaxID=2862543 RepID=UPI001C9A0CA3|nr:transporter [Lysobacter antarcticus]
MNVLPIAITVVLAGVTPLAAIAQEAHRAQPAPPAPQSQSAGASPERSVDPQDQADVRALLAELEALKGSYAQEVRRLRELDMRVQALQARVDGKTLPAQSAAVASSPPPAPTATRSAAASPPTSAEGYASSPAEAAEAKEAAKRSVDDVKQQVAAVFDRRLTLENAVTYNRYDRKQLTLTGFLALDAIFLGNIAIENVESDTLTYNFAARYGLNPRLTLNLDVPYIARKTVYQKGGAGGSAGAVAQEDTYGHGFGDITVSGNYRMFMESPRWPETVLTLGVTAPTGREPYGISWEVLERDDDGFIRFAVPEKEPTGNGVWQTNVGVSVVKTADPAILFGNFGYIHSFSNSFDDLDNNPETVNPGDVQLGRSFYFGAGVAFAFNERTSLSISYSDKLSARARTRYDGQEWVKIIGSDANAGMFNLGVTYALSQHTTLVSSLGIGLTPDAPDFSLVFKVPYML